MPAGGHPLDRVDALYEALDARADGSIELTIVRGTTSVWSRHVRERGPPASPNISTRRR